MNRLWRLMCQKMRKHLCNETGASVIEVAVIIVVMVIVALIFKDQLVTILTAIMDKVTAEISGL